MIKVCIDVPALIMKLTKTFLLWNGGNLLPSGSSKHLKSWQYLFWFDNHQLCVARLISTNDFPNIDTELYKGPIATERGQNKRNIHQTLSTELDALADIKFSYVISCQKFGEQKIKGDHHAQDIIDLMARYPSAFKVAEKWCSLQLS
jgi:hypothetical protein